MKVELDEKEISDIRRGLIIAMHALDLANESGDALLSDRLEVIEAKLSKVE